MPDRAAEIAAVLSDRPERKRGRPRKRRRYATCCPRCGHDLRACVVPGCSGTISHGERCRKHNNALRRARDERCE